VLADNSPEVVTVVTVPPSVAVAWHPITRIAFRFFVVYFGLYVLCTQMIGSVLTTPVFETPSLGTRPPVSTLVFWVIRQVFHDTRTLQADGGSGDKMFDWVQALCFLVIAAIATVVWSIVDWRRVAYPRLDRWFRVFLRFSLGATMVTYGSMKAIPLQMPYPQLLRLLEPFGNFSPMGVLWYSIGASRPYEMIVGTVELVAGITLFIPRTQLLGASIAFAATTEVFILNMTYDVPAKLFSFHLVVMSLVLFAPDVKRVCDAVFDHRVKRWGLIAQIALGMYLVACGLYQAQRAWSGPFGGGGPKPPLYGIWTIDKMLIDDIERAPLVTDYERWRRVVIQNPTSVSFWRMDDTVLTLPGKVDAAAQMIAFRGAAEATADDVLTFDQPTPERLVLDGVLNEKRLHIETRKFDRQKFLLVSRGFHWVQELPFNR